jgi:hypothetical protein
MFGKLMFEAWVAADRPPYAAVAKETRRALIPLTEEQVKGFVEGDAVPASSYQIDALLASLGSYSEFELDGYRPLIMASWDALFNVSTEKPPETTGAGFEGISNILDHVVEVATYLGAAGVGGNSRQQGGRRDGEKRQGTVHPSARTLAEPQARAGRGALPGRGVRRRARRRQRSRIPARIALRPNG